MSAEPRKNVFDPQSVGVYHCYNRCVRRAYLLGKDAFSQRHYGHRKGWIRERLKLLASTFALDILDFAAMDNHLHVLLRNRPDVSSLWSEEEVARRWWQVCPQRRDEDGSPAEPHALELAEWLGDPKKIRELRERLGSISWFMKLLCQNIARRANREDEVTGKFFEPRFKCEAIKDETALLACSMYVNLNPIRAGKVLTPADSVYTSIYERIQGLLRSGLQISTLDELYGGAPAAACGADRPPESVTELPDDWLCPLTLEPIDRAGTGGGPQSLAQANAFPASRASEKGYLPLDILDYLRLLEWTGQQIRTDKRGAIPADLPPLAMRLGIKLEQWPEVVVNFRRWFRTAAGRVESMRAEAQRRGRHWLHGVRRAAAVFS